MRASDVAYEQLRAEIIDWVLEPGAPLGEIETAERVGVSRTPVREALARLSAEGLVVYEGRYARVAPLSRDRITELYELREALETQAARLAARRRDPERFERLLEEFELGPDAAPSDGRPYFLSGELDAAIDEAVGSRYLRAALDDLRGQMARIRHHSSADPVRLVEATREHVQIVRAILAGDEFLAVHATAVHLHNSRVNVETHLSFDDSVDSSA
ncbi:GntR family transcriptional regulator [Microbacterium aquimaris]|uniref:GntR family transcriptional regulator n=1 Tax=Microbacterium aquimaris TaxID=459816 RepID=UPI002AD53CBA|nr:GntR family transcriptional regulator [Microbacterium aquimaris]MDZ8275048.1 GntR family transcriptional regulator [Microbacterium aquimaris]